MPFYQGFCGSSNPTQSPLADAERTMNWLPEVIQSPFAPTSVALFPTPGQSAYVTVSPDINTRGGFSLADRTFVVVGSGLYELFNPAGYTKRGTVAQDENPATISSNGIAGGQLFITSGGNGYCYDLTTNVLTLVLTNEATQGGMKDGYFLAFNVANGRVRLSALNNGLTWTSTQYFARSIAPDPWKAMIVANPLIWMVGEVTSEAWYNAGNFPQPFAPDLSSFVNYGTTAPFSVFQAGETIGWLSNTVAGSGTIVAGSGYTLKPLSNYAVDTDLGLIDRAHGVSDCETLVYEEDGHLFACFSFPAGNKTWVVDLLTGMWHERGSWNGDENRYDYWHPRIHLHAFGKSLVGERATGQISEMSTAHGSEADGGVIRRLRIPPPLWAAPNARLSIARLSLYMDTGLGLTTGQGVDPKVMLRVSTNGRAWGNQRSCSAAALGRFDSQVYFTRCGSSRTIWMPEIVVSDPVPFRLLGADLQGEGYYQQGRAA